jgi:hypothetical protein
MTKSRLTCLGAISIFGLLAGCAASSTTANADDYGNPSNAAALEPYSNVTCPVELAAPDPSCPCSRRACSPPSMNCRRGSGESQTTRLGLDGGTAVLGKTPLEQELGFSVEVFPGSLAHDLDIKLTELHVPTPDGYEDWSPIYSLEPFSVTFANGGVLQVPWEVPRPGGGSVPKELAIYTSPNIGGPWAPLSDSYTNAGFSMATALTGGYFFVGYPEQDECQ